MCLLAAPREGGDAVDFVAVVDQAIALLRQRGRLTYGTLKRQFQLDDAALDDLKDELIVGQRLAVDEDGRVLVWTGGSSSAPTTASPLPPSTTLGVAPAQVGGTLVAPPAPEAERRQLTVMFCDLVDSTRISRNCSVTDCSCTSATPTPMKMMPNELYERVWVSWLR